MPRTTAGATPVRCSGNEPEVAATVRECIRCARAVRIDRNGREQQDQAQDHNYSDNRECCAFALSHTRSYSETTQAPPRPRLCWSARRAPSTWVASAVPRNWRVSS